jgi:hypothetical protein
MVGSVESNIKDIIKNKDKELSELAKSCGIPRKRYLRKRRKSKIYVTI